MTFLEKLNNAWRARNSMLCVGLDPDPSRMPAGLSESDLFPFCRDIVDATAAHVCAFKPQFAYFAAVGAERALEMTIAHIRTSYPDIVVILDAKRGDIGATATMYAQEAFVRYNADAVTVNPYMGGDTLQPFTAWQDRGVIALCRTSNSGSGELQALPLRDGGESVAMRVAALAADRWNHNGNLALVVGATWPDEVLAVRQRVGDMPLLIPGIGAQGGDLEAVLRAGVDSHGYGLMINASRSIIHASEKGDFAAAAASQATQLVEQIRARTCNQ